MAVEAVDTRTADSEPALQVPGATHVSVLLNRGGKQTQTTDWLADEVPVSLVFNGLSHAVMLATPLDIEDMAIGFAFTEGFLQRRAELYGVEVETTPLGIEAQLEVSSACFARLKDRRRSLAGRTGCGLCGTESLEHVHLSPPPLRARPAVQASAIADALKAVQRFQVLQRSTGAVHAAAWCDLSGSVLLCREDVGRHNALDKVIGAMLVRQVDPSTGFLLVTSRASFEMVQKTAMAGVSMLIAISAATERAQRVATGAGVCLVGFARQSNFVAYTFPDRILFPRRG